MLLSIGERCSPSDAVPSFKASAATARARVLRDEDGVTAHRRLLAVIWDDGGSKTGAHKILGVLADGVHPFGGDIRFILFA